MGEVIGTIISLLVPIILIFVLPALGYVVGRSREKSHLRSLAEREALFNEIIVTNWKMLPAGYTASKTVFCSGNVVIASDSFKSFIAGIINIGGGRVLTLESLMDRARREALLRMAQIARDQGCNMILNARFETLILKRQSGGKGLPMVEMMAYGTGVVLEKPAAVTGPDPSRKSLPEKNPS